MTLSVYTQAAVDVARKAGEYILAREKGRFQIEEKVSSYDYVTDVDTASEAMIRKNLQALFPDHGFAGEESGMDEAEMKHSLTHMAPEEYCWVADPLDGTINFIHGLGGYAVSLALLKGNEVISGAIYLPTRGEMFCAEQGGGVWCNGEPVRVSACTRMQDALIACSVPATDMNLRREVVAKLAPLAMDSFNLRMIGSAAAAIAYIACGRLDAYVELGHHPWDVAAGMLMVREASGELTNHSGEALTLADPRMVASNGRFHRQILDTLAKANGCG